MRVDEFLNTVVSTPEGCFLLALRDPTGMWSERWYGWPEDVGQIVAEAQDFAQRQHDVYFTSHLFGEKRSTKGCVLPTRTVQADLDYADPFTLPVIPTVLVNTSPERHQAYWVLEQPHTPQEIESIGRRIAYGVRDCDRTGWTAGHRMRLPGTLNFKYTSPQRIEIMGHALKMLDPEAFNLFPLLQTTVEHAQQDTTWIMQDVVPIDAGPMQLMNDAMFAKHIITQYDKPAKDRSKALWGLMMEGFRRGLQRDQVFWLAWNCANNKFKDDHRYSAVQDLRKDVLRAEVVALDRTLDTRAAIMDLRMLKGITTAQRHEKVLEIVVARMRDDGELIHTRGGQLWFLRKDTGRPVEISERSTWLDTYLWGRFRLNHVEVLTRFVKHALVGHVQGMAPSSDLSVLSHYQHSSNVLLLHTGGRDVLHIRPDAIDVHPNGFAHTVFTVDQGVEPFKMGNLGDLGGRTWYDTLFGNQMQHIEGSLDSEEAVVLLRAWFLALLFRARMPNRPILAMLGQPGSGKTTTAKMLYRFLYGHYRHITTIEDTEKFDQATINLPFVTFDNVDTYERWLPDSLAQAASVTDVVKRRLYTDADTITQRRQAMIMLTAHNPQFTRADVVDRMIILTLQRLPKWGSESAILDEISDLRNALWADVVRDVQNVLATPKPAVHEIPQFRIEDYAALGMWFSRAAGLEKPFVRAIDKMVGRQRGMNIETDQLLVATLTRLVKQRAEKNIPPTPMSQPVLYNDLKLRADDTAQFEREYRSPLYMGRKLMALLDTLKSVFSIEVGYDGPNGVRVWTIGPKEA